MTLTIAVANLKGGTAKSTSAAYLAHAFAGLGRSVIVVDADPQQSITEWAELAHWTIPTIGLAEKTLHRRLPGIVGRKYDVVIIDTPGVSPQNKAEAERAPVGIVHSAMRAADLVVIPIGPTTMEARRIARTLLAVQDAGKDPRDVWFLLNRAVANAGSTEATRDLLTARGSHVFQVAIPRREPLAQAMGSPITGPLFGHQSAAMQLLEETP